MEWSKNNKDKPRNPNTKKLKEEINATQDLYQYGAIDLAEIFAGNFHARHYGEYISQDDWNTAKEEASKYDKEFVVEGRR